MRASQAQVKSLKATRGGGFGDDAVSRRRSLTHLRLKTIEAAIGGVLRFELHSVSRRNNVQDQISSVTANYRSVRGL
jgi:hypothetical protein